MKGPRTVPYLLRQLYVVQQLLPHSRRRQHHQSGHSCRPRLGPLPGKAGEQRRQVGGGVQQLRQEAPPVPPARGNLRRTNRTAGRPYTYTEAEGPEGAERGEAGEGVPPRAPSVGNTAI